MSCSCMFPCHRLVLVSYNIKVLLVLFCQIVPKSCLLQQMEKTPRYKLPQSFPGCREEMAPFHFPFFSEIGPSEDVVFQRVDSCSDWENFFLSSVPLVRCSFEEEISGPEWGNSIPFPSLQSHFLIPHLGVSCRLVSVAEHTW